jgi:hypothetical protein
MSSIGSDIGFNAQAVLRKWPSFNNERISASLGARPYPYLVVDRSLDECIRQFPPAATILFWLQPMDVMVFSPRLRVRGIRGKGCQEESKANGKRRRRSQLRIRFCGVKRFLSLHKSFVKRAQGNPARFAPPDFSVAGTGLRKRLAVRRNSL